MKILLTGFDPFDKETINPSWEVIKDISIANVSILQLPTSFKRARSLLIEEINSQKPDIVLSIGQAGGRSKISLEKIAINLMDARIADNDGNQPKSQKIIDDGSDGYFSSLDVEGLVEFLNDKQIPATMSLSAGAYVCNTVLYSALYKAESDGSGMKAGFIHIPYISEQVIDKPADTPFMQLEMIKAAIILILEKLMK